MTGLETAPTVTGQDVVSVRDAVKAWLRSVVESADPSIGGPCTVIRSRDAYASVEAMVPGTARPTIREALQSIAVGSGRKGGKQSRTVNAVYLRGGRDGGQEGRYLAIPELDRDRIGIKATDATGRIQGWADAALGKDVVNFWIRKTQLQCIAFSRSAGDAARRRDRGVCKLCIQNSAADGESVANEMITVCHLVRRRDVFWRILWQVAAGKEDGDPPPPVADDIDWSVIFTAAGAGAITAALEKDEYHSASAYVVCLCRHHDKQVQDTLYPQHGARSA